jgi:hypothetical protein
LQQESANIAFNLGQIAKPDVNASLEQSAKERNAAGEPVNLAHDERAAVQDPRSAVAGNYSEPNP